MRSHQKQVSRPAGLAPAPRHRGVRSGQVAPGAGPTLSRVIYRLNWSPALAEIVGDGRPWTVLMISLLSMPCR
jgi:hypothetical protein